MEGQLHADKIAEGMLFGTTKHIINKGAVQIFTTRTNNIKKGFVILYIVFSID